MKLVLGRASQFDESGCHHFSKIASFAVKSRDLTGSKTLCYLAGFRRFNVFSASPSNHRHCNEAAGC